MVELVEQTVDELRERASEKHVALRWRIDDVPVVWADPTRLLQVLVNLVGNAIKFTPSRGSVEIRVAAVGPSTRFEVRDTGPGISVSDVLHLFDRYWKGRSSGRKGVGLGLYIAKGIVDGHGGEIWVESAIGRGSTFIFTVPARSARAGRSEATAGPGPAPPPDSGRPPIGAGAGGERDSPAPPFY